jgi:hypothetical protein
LGNQKTYFTMKQFITLLAVCALFSCKQVPSNANQADTKPPPDAPKEAVAEKPKSKGSVSELSMQDGGAVVPNPLKKLYTLVNAHPESEIHQIFFKYKEFDRDKTHFESSMAIPIDMNVKAFELLEQVRAIENGKTFEPVGPPCVGKSGTNFNLNYFEGDSAKFTVTGGALCEKDKLPAVVSGLHAMMESLATEAKAEAKLMFFNKINGKKWQNKADPANTLEFNNGHLTITEKGSKEPQHVFVHFSFRCPDGKKEGEGMSAGNLGCMTTWAQDEVHYRITDFGENVLEFNQTPSSEKTKMQVFKRVAVAKK